jgi:hypothetical protein
MANKIYLTQRTNRHVVKRLDSTATPATYDSAIFGTWGIPGSTSSTLNFPWGVTRDSSGSIYVCDTENKRIVKLDSSLAYLTSYDTSATVGVPYSIFYELATNNIYVVGVELIYGAAVRIERLTTSFVQTLLSSNLGVIKDLSFKPVGICRGEAGKIWVVGADLDIFETIESGSFSPFITRSIYREITTYPELFTTTRYNGIVHHSNGSLYVTNGRKIIRALISISPAPFVNVGDSDFVSKTIYGLKEGVGGSLLVYCADSSTIYNPVRGKHNQKIMRFDDDLNFVDDVYIDSGSAITTDAYEIMDFVEATV